MSCLQRLRFPYFQSILSRVCRVQQNTILPKPFTHRAALSGASQKVMEMFWKLFYYRPFNQSCRCFKNEVIREPPTAPESQILGDGETTVDVIEAPRCIRRSNDQRTVAIAHVVTPVPWRSLWSLKLSTLDLPGSNPTCAKHFITINALTPQAPVYVLTKHAVVFLLKLSSSPDSTTATLSSTVCLHPHYNPYPRSYSLLLV